MLQKYIGDVDALELKETFNNALTALQYLKENPVDLIFLDIHLPKISGIDFLKILTPKPKVVITTVFQDYALQGYEHEVLDYLLKPFSFERFLKAVSKIIYSSNTQRLDEKTIGELGKEGNDFLFIKSGHDYINIKTNDIKYVKSEGDYTCIFTSQSKHLVSESLKDWQGSLPDVTFCQVHKSFIVNVQHISKVTGNQVFIDKEIIPIGRAFKDRFFNDYLKK